MSNTNVGALIERMSDYLDKGRPSVQKIVVRCRRSSVMRYVKPAWRGGPLKAGDREIVTLDPVPVPVKPEPKKRKRAKAR
jgi:hypothetical protein